VIKGFGICVFLNKGCAAIRTAARFPLINTLASNALRVVRMLRAFC
jgi:hypothetical protein